MKFPNELCQRPKKQNPVITSAIENPIGSAEVSQAAKFRKYLSKVLTLF